MDIRHFNRAEDSRTSCVEKLAELRGAPDFQKASAKWSEFLTDHHRWFTRMQQALQAGPSSAWFGRLKAFRKSDVLLAYLQQARHADEHGLDPVSQGASDALIFGRGAQAMYIDNLSFKNGKMTIVGSEDGLPIIPQFMPAHLKLNPVTQRGEIYQPPTVKKRFPPHYVEISVPMTALEVGAGCLEIMERLANEGRQFFQNLA